MNDLPTNITPEPPELLSVARRILGSPPVRVVLLGFVLVMMALNTDVMTIYASDPLKSFRHIMSLAIAGLAVFVGYAIFFEGRAVPHLSVRGMGRELGLGLLLSVSVYAVCEVLLMVMGIYQIKGLNPLSFMILEVAMSLSTGVYEELLFRGVLYGSVERWLGSGGVVIPGVRPDAPDQFAGHGGGGAVHRGGGGRFAGGGVPRCARTSTNFRRISRLLGAAA